MSESKQSVSTAIIIPTCGLPHIEKHLLSVFRQSSKDSVIILSINSSDMDYCESVIETVQCVKRYVEDRYLRKVNLVELWHDEAIGFGEACNKGYEYLLENYEGFKSIIFLNDDVTVGEHWDQKLTGCLYSNYYTTQHIASTQPGTFFDINDLGGEVGIVGPLSNYVAGDQAMPKSATESLPFDQLAKTIEQRAIAVIQNEDGTQSGSVLYNRIYTKFLSGFCLACKPEFLDQRYKEKGFIFDPRYLVGGFEDNDLCAWASVNNWVALIDASTYLEHSGSQTLSKNFAEQHNGMKNWSIHFDHWKEYTQRDQKLIGAYRVSFPMINSLAQMGSSLRINVPKLDGLAVLLTDNPAKALDSVDKQLFDRLHPHDQDFLMACKEAKNVEEIADHFYEWIHFYCPPDFNLKVELWDFDKEMNERVERNRVYEMASQMDADWVLSIDSDECLEDRVTREDLVALMKTPDPSILAYAFGWINHYESMSLVRHDYPYATGYRSGMNGVRMWRVFNGKHVPIRAGNNIGLHCGNAPELGAYGIRGTTIRFRHLSMVREIDRKGKVHYYNNIDKDRNPQMIGGENYFHIGRGENVSLSMYNPKNGIGSFILCYEEENEILTINQIASNSYMSDIQCLVWTGDWDEKDEEWIDLDVSEFPSESDWREKYPTGPSWTLAVACNLFGVVCLKRSISEGLAQCRNAAIEYFETNYDSKIGWAFYLDPDEQPEGGMHHTDVAACLRRMAEGSDTWAFRFKFQNPTRLQNGKVYPSPSESMRLIKVDRKLKLRFEGNVHETVEKRMNELKSYGLTPIVNECPIGFINVGLFGQESKLQNKLTKYTKLLVSSLNESPYDSSAWCSLGLTFEQDGNEKAAEICYERACLVAGRAFLPFKLLGSLYARMAMGLFYKAGELSKNVPDHYDKMMDRFKFLYDNIGEFPKIECGGYLVTKDIELPEFPYENIQYDDKMNQIVIQKDAENEDDNIGVRD